MKKTKKWISILLTVAMLFTLAVPAAFAAAMEGDLTGHREPMVESTM